MRAYFFGNFYLSSIQQGIQAAHVTHDMFVKYNTGPAKADGMLWDWASIHKTMILLNGGMASDLTRIETVFDSTANPYPWSAFREEEGALNKSITSVGIVLPERVYTGAATMRTNRWNIDDLSDANGVLNIPGPNGTTTSSHYTRFDGLVMDIMNKCVLAK